EAVGSNPAAPTKRRMLKGTRLFCCPQERIPVNATDPTKSTISTVSRYPTKPTKPTVSTKSRFHGTPRNARFQRNQRNHDFTAPQRNHESNDFNGFTIPHEKHESNGFNESNEMPEKKAFRCFRCVWINRDFVGNVGQTPLSVSPPCGRLASSPEGGAKCTTVKPGEQRVRRSCEQVCLTTA